MTRLPRLLDGNMQTARVLHPVAYKLVDNLAPLSTASLTLQADAGVKMRDFVELYTEEGSAGIFRVNNIRSLNCSVDELSLQHGLCTLADHMHPGESTETGSCTALLTKILSNQSIWSLGTVDVPEDQELTWECDNTNDLQGILSIMKELPAYYLDFDQSSVLPPWTLHVRAKPTEIACEARIDRNLIEVQIEQDDSEMCTLAYADGLTSPIQADTLDTWGEIARHVSVDEDLGTEVITQTVQRYLEQTQNPKLTITLTAIALSQLTGEPFDRFRKGMLCRCILDDMTVVQRIVSIEHPDPIGEPMNVVLTLASTQDDLSVTVAGLVVDIRHVNQLCMKLEKNLRVEAETIDLLAAEIALRATKAEVDGLSTRIAEAEITLNEVLGELDLRVTYTDFQTALNEVSVELDAVNASLSLKASNSALQSGLNEVSLRLDAMDSTIEAKADLILLDGYVKTSDLETETLKVVEGATISSFKTGGFNCSGVATINTAYITGAVIGSLLVGGVNVGDTLENHGALLDILDGASWQTVEVLTDGKVNCTTATSPMFYSPDDTAISTITYVKSASFVPTTTTIKYLGS